MNIVETTYKDIHAVRCYGSRLSATFAPEYGGKMLSLYDHETNRELLEQTVGKNYLRPAYDGEYIAAECSGFDDMFPTIDPCCYDEAPWMGQRLPDHGEVWALQWKMELEEDRMHLWTYSPRFAYRLDKWIEQKGNGLRVQYQATNLSQWDFKCLYAAHCMLAARDGAKLELPYDDQEDCVVIFSDFEELGAYGDTVMWDTQKGVSLSRTYAADTRKGFKVYFKRRIPEGWCRYCYNDGTALQIEFDPESMPYFAVWSNFGAFQNKYNVAIEPCTAPMDDPLTAKKYGLHDTLPAFGSRRWNLDFTMLDGSL